LNAPKLPGEKWDHFQKKREVELGAEMEEHFFPFPSFLSSVETRDRDLSAFPLAKEDEDLDQLLHVRMQDRVAEYQRERLLLWKAQVRPSPPEGILESVRCILAWK